jgi:hypothetical protein
VERKSGWWVWLTRTGGLAALLVAVMLLIGLAGLAVSLAGLGLRNWLVILFEINASVGSLPADPLHMFNPIDIVALVLVGVAFLGLWPVLGRINKIWMTIAVALPFAGIAVLLATGLAGRSAVMGGGLVIASLMFRNATFKPIAYTGLLANGLLFVGDLATGGPYAPVVAGLVAVGYVLLAVWFLLIGVRLLR